MNRFVPHAFSPKEFPDPDCPPHFYAHGHNPQYRHFGALMAYMDRMSGLLSDGRNIAPAAILYNATAEWTGEYLELQQLAAPLYDRQVDYDFIPEDAFTELGRYYLPDYQVYLVPGMQYITRAAWQGLAALHDQGAQVWFVSRKPEAFADSDAPVPATDMPVIALRELADRISGAVCERVLLAPENDRIRALHYRKDGRDIFLLVHEGTSLWRGTLTLPATGGCVAYDAWTDAVLTVAQQAEGSCTLVQAEIIPGKPLCLIFGMPDAAAVPPLQTDGLTPHFWNDDWRRSQCLSLDYPRFEHVSSVCLPDSLAAEQPGFSGFVRYEKTLHLARPAQLVMEISDAAEGVEAWCNGVSLGIQIVAPYTYDLIPYLHAGDNAVVIEVATTLERALCPQPSCESGLCGQVRLWIQEEEMEEKPWISSRV